MKSIRKIWGVRGIKIAMVTIILSIAIAYAAPGALLATVTLTPAMPSGTSVGGTFDGTNYISVLAGGTTLYVMTPPAGTGSATLVASLPIVDSISGTPVSISAVAWDPTRNKLWGAYSNKIYLIDISGPNAVAEFKFNPNVGGLSLVDGLAYDSNDDTLYYSPDVDCNVYQFNTTGTLLNTVTPKNSAGVSDCKVSGVAVGAANTLYIGRDGDAEIRRINKTTGDFISQFATTSGRVEDLTCDPVTYAPLEAILAKDAYNGLYEAFEVEPGTCPLPEEPIQGRMTGGGSVFTEDGMRVTHGFTLHCDDSKEPNNLQVNWGKGNKFHLESLDSAFCSDDPNIDEAPPVAGFDTYKGVGMGRYNGVSGATAKWIFTDAGEPGKNNDHAEITITDAGGNVVLTVSGTLNSGNQQAHED